ncbi:MAG: hypothetical protein ACJASD_001483 [Sphingomonas echinoides]
MLQWSLLSLSLCSREAAKPRSGIRFARSRGGAETVQPASTDSSLPSCRARAGIHRAAYPVGDGLGDRWTPGQARGDAARAVREPSPRLRASARTPFFAPSRLRVESSQMLTLNSRPICSREGAKTRSENRFAPRRGGAEMLRRVSTASPLPSCRARPGIHRAAYPAADGLGDRWTPGQARGDGECVANALSPLSSPRLRVSARTPFFAASRLRVDPKPC